MKKRIQKHLRNEFCYKKNIASLNKYSIRKSTYQNVNKNTTRNKAKEGIDFTVFFFNPKLENSSKVYWCREEIIEFVQLDFALILF